MDKMLAKAAEPPNNSQKAVAKCILAFVAEEKRQAWKIESGYGKSRVIAYLAMAACLTKKFTEVYIVTPT